MSAKDEPIIVDGHDELRHSAETAFAPLEVKVAEHDGRVGIALPYEGQIIFVLFDEGKWYPCHGPLLTPCENDPVLNAQEFNYHMIDFWAGM